MNFRNSKKMLHEMSWQEAKEYFLANDIAILPVGSNEQHGPQNPLGTDHLIAKSIAEEAARHTGVVCLQVVPFGVSSHHRQFWGTISISASAFKEYVKEICLSLMYFGVKKIVIVNGHGGNTGPLLEVARELREIGLFISIYQWWEATSKLLPDLFDQEERGHAGAEETSVNLALHPEIVDPPKAVDEEPRENPARTAGISLPLDTLDRVESGVFGRSTTASAEKGKVVLGTAIDELVKHITVIRQMKPESLLPRSKI